MKSVFFKNFGKNDQLNSLTRYYMSLQNSTGGLLDFSRGHERIMNVKFL